MNIKGIIAIAILFTFSATCSYLVNSNSKQTTPEVQQKEIKSVIVKPKTKKVSKGVYAFMRQMSRIESEGKADVVNRFGMMGKYQFSPKTLKAMGINVSQEEFLSNPELQDQAMIKLLKNNKRALRKVINEFAGTTVNGIYITESGILAGAHLVGVGGVRSYFYPEKYAYQTSDANGTTIEFYLKKFANFNLKSI